MARQPKPKSPWPPTAPTCGSDILVLDADLRGADDPTLNLSAAARFGRTLFLGSDEGASVECLHRGETEWIGHERLALDAILDLDSTEEADIEGLAVDDGWLWVLGSHARTRPKIAKDGADRIDLKAFANLKDTRPRCLLARIPLKVEAQAPDLARPVERDGTRRAGMLKQTRHGNKLARLLTEGPLLGPFTQIAAKEGGVDLEGLAVSGNRVAIGMRGPVIQSYAVLLETELEAKTSGALKLAGPLFKRLLDLEGLGIRDLKLANRDLLILAGPTTALDGPCAVYRWTDWLGDPPRDETVVRLHRPERILELPFGRSDDHPEGLLLLDGDGDGGGQEVLVICDGPSEERMEKGRRSVRCDRFRLPAPRGA